MNFNNEFIFDYWGSADWVRSLKRHWAKRRQTANTFWRQSVLTNKFNIIVVLDKSVSYYKEIVSITNKYNTHRGSENIICFALATSEEVLLVYVRCNNSRRLSMHLARFPSSLDQALSWWRAWWFRPSSAGSVLGGFENSLSEERRKIAKSLLGHDSSTSAVSHGEGITIRRSQNVNHLKTTKMNRMNQNDNHPS